MQRRYRALLPRFVSRPGLATVILVSAFAVTGFSLPWLGEEFLPNFKETDFLMHWVEKPGTSLGAMRRITERVSRELHAVPGVRNFGSHIGRAEVADEVVGPNFTELWISIEPNAEYDTTVHKIQEIVDGYPGLYRDVLTYLKERIKEVLTGASATIVVRIFGPDMHTLRAKAKEVAAVMEKVPDVTDLKIEPQVLAPQVTVRLRPEAAELFGLTPGHVRRTATTLVQGAKVGEVFQQQRAYAVTVWGAETVRGDVNALGDLLIDLPRGGQVPLRDVAEPGTHPARRRGTTRADPDDRPVRRPGPCAARAGRQQARPRNRIPDGRRDPRRTHHLHFAEPRVDAGVVRKIRTRSREAARVTWRSITFGLPGARQ